MSYQMNPSHVATPGLIQTVQNCAVTCEQMVTHLLHMSDVHNRVMQIQLLRDCVTICDTMVCYLARHSPFAKSLANFCACVCDVCGKECAKFPDPESQHCSRVCFHCAQECRMFAAS
ncbi:hypothetical protein J2T20_003182 [Paenibacillus wynnii]|nr:hypothetical protein [Paenibacillus wynnii]